MVCKENPIGMDDLGGGGAFMETPRCDSFAKIYRGRELFMEFKQ